MRLGAAAQAVEKLGATLRKLAGKGKISEADAEAAIGRLVVGPAANGDLAALPAVGLVIEAAVERLDVGPEGVEADDAAALARIQDAFRARLLELDPGLSIPF